MKPEKNQKYTINYTQQDNEQLLINTFIKLIVDKHHPEIINKAKQLAREYVEQHGEPT